MRKLIMLIAIICSSQALAQIKPYINGSKTLTNYVSIASISNSDTWTEVVLSFNPSADVSATLHEPNGKSPFVIKDREGNDHLLVYQKGWGGDKPGGYGSILLKANRKKEITLFFNKLDKLENVYSLNETNCEGSGCWFFNDISFLDEKAGKAITEAKGVMVSASAEQNVMRDGSKGVVINLNLRVMNLKNKACQIALRFQSKDDVFLKTSNSKYANSRGEIIVIKDLIPSGLITEYEKLSFFVPYAEFKLTSGSKDVKVDFDINGKDGRVINHITISSLTLNAN